MANDRLTWFGVTYDLSDVNAIEDSNPVSSDNQEFGDLGLLKLFVDPTDTMTLEHNHAALMGSLLEFPDSPEDVAFMSQEMSDSSGYFEQNPTIDITFQEYHSSAALTLYFDQEHPLQVRVFWYRDDLLLARTTVNVTSDIQIVEVGVQLYNKITVEFIQTLPYHYAKLYSIRYGIVIEWNESNLKRGSVVQEISHISDKIPINTLSFDVVDIGQQLNFGNESGLHHYYQRSQSMIPYEMVNGQRINFGKFFLNKFSNDSNLGKMTAVSVLGKLDTIQFNDGDVYSSGVLASDLIEHIFSVAGVEDYTVDSETANQILYGSLPPMTCRNALKEVLFACNAAIDTSVDPISIFQFKRSISGEIPRSMKFSTKVSLNEYVSGVEIKFNTYTLASETTEIINDEYTAGTHTVVFSTPYTDLQITGGTIVSSMPYYVEFECDSTSTVVITGKQYTSTTNSAVQNVAYIDPGEVVNVKTFTAKLCNAKTASILAKKLLDHFDREKLSFNVKHIAVDNEMNGGIDLENASKGYGDFIAWYNRRSFDMTGGFIDTAQLTGNYSGLDGIYPYTGTELYAGSWDTEII